MENVITRIEVDLYSPTSYEVIKAQQGDSLSRIVEIALLNKGEPYVIPTQNVSIRLEGHRGDGSSFSKSNNCTLNNNVITVVLDNDILFYSGTVEAKVVLYELPDDGTKRILSSIPFRAHVQKNPCDKNNVTMGNKSLIDDLIFDFTNLEVAVNKTITDEIDRATKAEKDLDAKKVDKTTIATSSTLGLVKSGTDIIVDSSGNVSVKDNSHKHTVSNISDLTATASELNVLDGITSTTTELNKLHGTTATVDDFNKLHDVTASASELNIMDGVTATTTELNYVDGVTSNIQTQLNGKQPNITGGATTITSSNLTTSRALISNSSGKVAVSDVTSTELGYLDGVTSNIQTQLNAKAPLESPTLTGNPTAPTPTSTSNNKQIATTEFVKNAVSDLVDSAPETLDTLGELAKALKDNADIVDVLNESIATKANASDLTSHTSNTTVHITSTERSNWNDANDKKHMHSNKSVLDKTTASYTTEEQEKLSGIKEGAEPITATISGSNPTATNSTNAPLIYGKFKGYTLQDGEPTPDNLIEINGLAKDGAIEVKTCGKNMLKVTVTTQTINSVIFTVNEDKSIAVSGTSGETEASISINSDFSLPAGTYVLNGNPFVDGTSRLYVATTNNEVYSDFGLGGTTFTLSEETKMRCGFVFKSATSFNGTLKPMIRLALIEDATYEPYTETTTTIPTDAPLYEGDYLEVYADGSGKLYRKMKEVVFDGSDDELWAVNGVIFQSRKILNASIPIWSNTNKQKSSHFNVGQPYGDGDDCFSINNNNILSIRYNSVTTLEDFNTWLQSNPVTVVYELATPTKTELTAEQVEQFKKLYTFEPVTNVLCDGEVTIRYYVNTDSGDTVGMLQDSITTKLNKDFGNVDGILPVTNGGTGKTNATDACNAFINALSVSTDTPSDADYYVSQYAGGGTTTTTYHRRPISALWNYIKSKLATVATSGSYNDLSNKPTIGNGTVTIKQAGTSKGTFTMNQSGNTTIELTDNNTTYGVATQSANGLESAADKKKLDGIATGAEVNQNAFSNVVVGTTTISADSKTDSLTLTGSNVTLTPDATNDKVTIGITKANVTSALGYTPPTTNTTYGVATSSTLGLVKSGTDITVDSSGNVSVNDDSHNHVISNVDGLQTALDGKANTSHGTHVSYGTSASALGTSSAGSATTVSRSDHVHALPALTSCTGTLSVAKGGTGATDAATARTNLGITPANIGAAASSHTHSYLPLSGGILTGNLTMADTKNIMLRAHESYLSGICYDTKGNECISLWAKNTVTRLRWNAGVDMSTMVAGKMMDITPDFEISKASGSAMGYIAGTRIVTNSGTWGISVTGNSATATNVAWSGVTSKPSYYDAKAIKGITRSGTTFTYTCMDGSTGTFTQQDNNTTYGVVSTSANGLAPKRDGSTTKYLRADGTWAVPPDTNTTYTSLKNPYALTIQGNGTTLTNGTYDGSAAKTVNITPSSIGAAASSHGTHVTYSTTKPVMDGTASVGTATTVARSDHKHPTDTSRASTSSVLSTVAQCTASTTSSNIAGASALAELNNSLSTKIIETVYTTETVTTASGAFNILLIPKPEEEYTLINAKIYATSNSTHLYQYTITVVENRHFRVFNNYPDALTDAFTIKAYWVKL